MPKREVPVIVQLERQCQLTLFLLPHVAALPWVDEEAIVRTFGQAMLFLNWIPEGPTLPMSVAEFASRFRRPRTKEEQRAYWREAKRRERMKQRNP